jgi:hypothetical protein
MSITTKALCSSSFAVAFLVLSTAVEAQPNRRPGRGTFLERIKAYDKNNDGKITNAEASGPVAQRFARIDTNGDGVIDQAELTQLANRIGRRRTDQDRGGLAVEGKTAPDFKLKSLDGKRTVKLSSFSGKKPVALVFGSYT